MLNYAKVVIPVGTREIAGEKCCGSVHLDIIDPSITLYYAELC
jgi:hypothetical protein